MLDIGRTSSPVLQEPKPATGNTLPAAYEQSAAHKDEFFARKMSENASRRDGVPPSQGGKYVGFGSTPPPDARPKGEMAELTGMFASGWSRFTAVASAAAAQASTSVSTTARSLDEQYRSGQLAHNVHDGATHALTTAQQLGQTGWGMLSSFARNASKTATSAATGTEADVAARDDWGGHGGFDTPESVAAAAPHMGRGDGAPSAGWGPPRKASDPGNGTDYLSGRGGSQSIADHARDGGGAADQSGSSSQRSNIAQRRRNDAMSSDWDSGW